MILKPSGDDLVKYLDYEKLYRYLKIADKGRLPENIRKVIENSSREFQKMLTPHIIIREFEDYSADCNKIVLVESEIESAVLARISAEAVSVYVFILTIGDMIEKKCSEYAKNGEYFMSQIADAYASVYTEATLDYTLSSIEKDISKNGFLLSNPYSPGYCDITLSQQKTIFELLKSENNIVSLSESFQMYPEKSISGLFFRMKKEVAQKFKEYLIFCSECKNRFCRHYRG